MKTKKLKSQLAKYGALVASTAVVAEADAAIIYTDIVPDFSGGIGSQYFLDLNNDGTDDFRIYHNGGSSLYIAPLVAGNGVLGSGGATFAYPFALSSGAMINSSASAFFTNGFSGGYQSLNYGSCSFGNWCSITDKYLGFEFMIGGNTHYGWARLDVDANGNLWTVKDYAYDDVAGTGIPAGAMSTPTVTADPVTAIVGTDIAENSNGSDLQVDFTAAANEATVSEYRIMVVKAANAGTFDLAAAQAVISANYTAITPNASPTYTQVISAGGLDVDGTAITIAQPYHVFVLSVADGVNANVDTLATAATDITLNTTADVALSVAGSDISDNGDATDLQVDFDAAANESGVASYRAIAVKNASAGTFDLTAAQALAATAYEEVAADGSTSYTVVFNSVTTDSDGAAIVENQPYTIFIHSVANGTMANLDNLTNSSSDVTLTSSAASLGENALENVLLLSFKDHYIVQVPETAADWKLLMVNSAGQVVAERSITSSQTKITKAQSTGIYYLTVRDDKGEERQFKLLF